VSARPAIGDTMRADWREATRPERVTAIALLIIAVAIRLAHIRQTMRHDEAYTYLHYASVPLASAMTDYAYPNNHLFHTLLVWVTTRLFGGSPIAIRLPAFVAGVLVVPAVYALARRFADRSPSLFAMALAAIWPALVLYSTNARGYSLICLAFVTLLLLADAVITTDSRSAWLGIVALLALGMFTAPVMLYPGGAALLWIVVEKTRRDGAAAARAVLPRLAATAALAGVLTAMAYLPLVLRAGIGPLVSNRYVTALSVRAFVAALPNFAGSLRESLALGVPLSMLGVLTAAAVAGLVWPREGRGRRIALALSVLVWCALLLVATRRPPPGRVWLFLVPLGCMYAGMGLAFTVNRLASLGRLEPRTVCGAVALIFAILFGASTVRSRVVFRSPETGTLVDAPDIATHLLARLRPGDRIVVDNPCGPPLDYYLLRRGNRRLDEINARADHGRVFVVVNPRHLQTLQSVQASAPDMPWSELVVEEPAVAFPPASVHTFRYATRE
jgi:hypothetical protein